MIQSCSIWQSHRLVLILDRQQRIGRVEEGVNEHFSKRVLTSFLYICFITLLKKIVIDYVDIKNVILQEPLNTTFVESINRKVLS